jgi:hypothetical protein
MSTEPCGLVFIQIKIGPEHCIMSQGGGFDNTVNMHEQQGEAACEICEISLRKGMQLPPQILGQVLVVVFLQTSLDNRQMEKCYDLLTLFRKARRRSCTDFPSYFLNFPRLSWNDLSSRARQSWPSTFEASVSSATRSLSRGSRHMISNLSEASCKNASRRSASQKKGWTKHEVVSGL